MTWGVDDEREQRLSETRELRKRIVELETELDSATKLTERQSVLLTGVVNALKGEPPPLTLWSHHDAPELARDCKAKLERVARATYAAKMGEALPEDTPIEKGWWDLVDRAKKAESAVRYLLREGVYDVDADGYPDDPKIREIREALADD